MKDPGVSENEKLKKTGLFDAKVIQSVKLGNRLGKFNLIKLRQGQAGKCSFSFLLSLVMIYYDVEGQERWLDRRN